MEVPESLPDLPAILNLAASSTKKPYEPTRRGLLRSPSLGEWAKDATKLKKTLGKFTNAFMTSASYEKVFFAIATKQNVRRFLDYWSREDCRWSKGEYLTCKIGSRLAKTMKCLAYGLRGSKSCEKAWWHCLWLIGEPVIQDALTIKQRIEDDIPLTSGQLHFLDHYLSLGQPCIKILWEDDRKLRIPTLIKPRPLKDPESAPFEAMFVRLLVYPCFELAQELQKKFSKPRFVRQCHAPSCNQTFYTRRRDAKCCPRKVAGRRSSCKAEWESYRRWLQNVYTDKMPENIWNDDDLKQEFLAQYRPRGSQSGMR